MNWKIKQKLIKQAFENNKIISDDLIHELTFSHLTELDLAVFKGIAEAQAVLTKLSRDIEWIKSFENSSIAGSVEYTIMRRMGYK